MLGLILGALKRSVLCMIGFGAFLVLMPNLPPYGIEFPVREPFVKVPFSGGLEQNHRLETAEAISSTVDHSSINYLKVEKSMKPLIRSESTDKCFRVRNRSPSEEITCTQEFRVGTSWDWTSTIPGNHGNMWRKSVSSASTSIMKTSVAGPSASSSTRRDSWSFVTHIMDFTGKQNYWT